jgi:hypothetical protein
MTEPETAISEVNLLPQTESDWADVLPGRQVEQEVIDIIDAP